MVLENWIATCTRMKLDFFLTPHTKINSKWIKDLKVRPETIKLSVWALISVLAIFWGALSPQARDIKAKINKWDYIELKSFCTAKETINKIAVYLMGEDTCKWYMQLIQLNNKKTPNNLIKKWAAGASLVAQWLGVCLPVQGTRVRALVWEDPTCRGAAGPVSHDYWACASGACAPQRERPQWWEARTPWWGVAPACHNWRKPSHRNEDPAQAINK